MSYPYYDLVLKANQELVDEDEITPLPPGHQEEVEDQKGLLTRRAGYYSNLRDANIGILEKTSGNNSMGYSVDILIHKDGTFYDVATDDGRQALPVNGGPGNDPGLISRWRQPTKELAGLDGTDPIPEPEPPPSDIDEKLDQIITNQGLAFAIMEQQAQALITIQEILNQHTAILQDIIAMGSGDEFPITYPNYVGKLLGFTATLTPEPRQNPPRQNP